MDGIPRNVIPFDRPAAYWRKKAERSKGLFHYAAAVRFFTHALKKSGDAGIRRGLADTYAAMRCLTASNRQCLQVLAQDPFDGKCLMRLAVNSWEQGRPRMTSDALSAYLYVAPYGDYAETAEAMLDHMPIGRETAGKRGMRAYTLLARSRRHSGAAAWRAAARAYRLDPSAAACIALAMAAASQGVIPLSLEFFRRTFRKDLADMACRLGYAQYLYSSGRRGACRAMIRMSAALAVSDEAASVYCEMACDTGSADLALEFASERSARWPQSADCLRLLAGVYRQTGQAARAGECMLAAYRLDGLEEPSAATPVPGDGALAGQGRAQRLAAALAGVGRRDAEGRAAREDALRLLETPEQWQQYVILSAFRTAGDVPSLRHALVLPELLPQTRAAAVKALLEMGAPLPYVSFDGEGLSLIRARRALQRDEDRTALMRTLAKWLNGTVPMERVWTVVPPLWGRLPEAARRHCARGADDVWPLAFALYLLGSTGAEHRTRRVVDSHPRKKRILRAYRQLLQRMETGNEMHRF